MTILNKEKLLEQARTFIEEGKYDRAIREYEKIIVADPEDLRVLLRMAELYVKNRQLPEAIRQYRAVAEQYTQQGFFLKAVTVYKNILRLNPALTEINQLLAELYERMSLTADALAQYELLASAFEQRGEWQRVLEIRRKISELSPDDGNAQLKLAELLQREGQVDEALKHYEAYAAWLAKEGLKEQRRAEIYERILAHHPDRVDIFRELVHIYQHHEDKKKALKWLESAKDITPYDQELLGLMARLYGEMNQIDSARSAYLDLVELMHESGDIDGMLRAYAEIMLLVPGDEETLRPSVEALKEGAWEQLQQVLAQRRVEIAEEEARQTEEARRREQEEQEREAQQRELEREKASSERRERIRKLRGEPLEPPPAPQRTPSSAASSKTAATSRTPDAPKEKTSPAASQPISSQEDVAQLVNRALATARLVQSYHRMGLTDEAQRAAQEARATYERACAQVDAADATHISRLQEVKALLATLASSETSAHLPADSAASSEASPPQTMAPTNQSESSPQQPQKKGKNKISFV